MVKVVQAYHQPCDKAQLSDKFSATLQIRRKAQRSAVSTNGVFMDAFGVRFKVQDLNKYEAFGFHILGVNECGKYEPRSQLLL